MLPPDATLGCESRRSTECRNGGDVDHDSAETLTFLFTDIEGSTRLWEKFPDAMKGALKRHDAILRSAIEASGGQVIKSTGDGTMAVFASAVQATWSGSRGRKPGRCACGWACIPG